MTFAEAITGVLVEFGGGVGGEPGNVAVRFLLPSFFWGVLAFVSLREWRRGGNKRDRYVGVASLVGLGRELLMFVSEYGGLTGLVSFDRMYGVYPPLEHAATMFCYVFTGAAFVHYQASWQRFSRRFFAGAAALTLVLYVVSAALWPGHLAVHPGAAFSSFWGDLAFRVSGVALLGLVLGLLIIGSAREGKIQKTLVLGFVFWFLDEFLMIVNIVTGEQHAAFLAPLRHNLHIWGIPIFLGVYWNHLAGLLGGALREVQQAKAEAEAIIAGIGDGLTIQDKNFRVLYQNRVHTELSGENVGRLCYEAYARSETICEGCPLALAFEDGGIHRSERVSQTRRGERHFEVTVSPLRDPAGEIVAGIELVKDVTERKVAESSLERSKAFNRSILETVDEGFVVIDREYRILSANRAYLAQAKLPLEAVIGKRCYEISHRAGRPCHEAGEECAVRTTLATGTASSALHTHYDSEGREVYVEIRSYPVKDETGAVVSAIEVVKDVTERRQLESQLRHAQKMEAVGHLAGGIAHDFNNILFAIIGFGTLMKMKMDPDDPQQHRLAQILSSADRAASLTQGLLAFSRKQVINLKPLNLNGVVASIEKLVRQLVGEEVEVQIDLAAQGLTVKADAGQIGQVLMNLATNARDAIRGRGVLGISTRAAVLEGNFVARHPFVKPGRYAQLSVRDTGEGMDSGRLENIFEPFFTTKEVGKGTGLGLSIAYGIVKQHDGYILCESRPGGGTVFDIYLPIVEAAGVVPEPEKRLPARSGRETVLVAEDDATVRSFMTELLCQQGYAVVAAVDGEDAVAKFTENSASVQLLILDVMMPRKNGMEVYQEIQKIRPEIKVIFASGYPKDLVNKKWVLDEGLSVIQKPVAPTELLERVRSLLDEAMLMCP
jgi:PAS domain S-box-containing protein